jgi:hypothetical protein
MQLTICIQALCSALLERESERDATFKRRLSMAHDRSGTMSEQVRRVSGLPLQRNCRVDYGGL